MRLALSLTTSLLLVLAALALAPPATADDPVPPPPPPPAGSRALPGGPPDQASVPVPDVRGMTETEARGALAQAGLRAGGVERVEVDRLEQELGRRYAPGLVVQQAPPPSAGNAPSWLPRGGVVYLRVSAGAPARVVPTQPAVPAQPGLPTVPYTPTQPAIPAVPYVPYVPAQPGAVRATGSPPPPPPPPYRGPQPTYTTPTQPYVAPVPGVPTAPTWQQPAPSPSTVCPPAAPLAGAALIGAPISRRIRLACERGRESGHFRALGGGSWSLGSDSGGFGWYGGADLGYTFDGCFGVDLFYRFESRQHDRIVPAGLLEDGGDTNHIGLKATYESSISRSSRFYFWAGLGPEYFWTSGYTKNDDGFGGFAELGFGYLISDDIRARLGVDVHAVSSSAGRLNAFDDNKSRLLWTVAPTLGLEIDF